MSAVLSENRAFFNQLRKYYGIYTGGFIAFVIALAIAEQMGMSRQWIGYWFLFATIALYAVIGIMSRTVDAAEYYVAGRRVPIDELAAVLDRQTHRPVEEVADSAEIFRGHAGGTGERAVSRHDRPARAVAHGATMSG